MTNLKKNIFALGFSLGAFLAAQSLLANEIASSSDRKEDMQIASQVYKCGDAYESKDPENVGESFVFSSEAAAKSANQKADQNLSKAAAKFKEKAAPVTCAQNCVAVYRPVFQKNTKPVKVSKKKCPMKATHPFKKVFKASGKCEGAAAAKAGKYIQDLLTGYGPDGKKLWYELCSDNNCSYYSTQNLEYQPTKSGCEVEVNVKVRCGDARGSDEFTMQPQIINRWVCEPKGKA